MMMEPQRGLPHRKPVPGPRASYNNLQQQQQQQYTPEGSRATSMARSSVSPSMTTMQAQQQQQQYSARGRTPSSATSSTSSITGNGGLQRIPTNASAASRRSTSSRSNSSASPTSYVALMRKQKATVWCDRAQAEDPRILAAQRAAKMRAAMEVAGGSHRFSTSSNAAPSAGIRSKIRHHGAPKATAYTGQANLAGAAVPMRLSASEVDENDSDEEDSKYVSHYHMRNSSRNSSMGNSGRGLNYQTGSGNNSTPRSGHSPSDSMGNLPEEETPVPTDQNLSASDYFSAANVDDEQAEQSYGSLSNLPQRTGDPEQDRKTAEELRRRGSVDDRSMTMTGTRLFIANPDADSD